MVHVLLAELQQRASCHQLAVDGHGLGLAQQTAQLIVCNHHPYIVLREKPSPFELFIEPQPIFATNAAKIVQFSCWTTMTAWESCG